MESWTAGGPRARLLWSGAMELANHPPLHACDELSSLEESGGSRMSVPGVRL